MKKRSNNKYQRPVYNASIWESWKGKVLAIGILVAGSLLFVGGFYMAERTFISASRLFTLWLAGGITGTLFFRWLWRREENYLGGFIGGILLFIYGAISFGSLSFFTANAINYCGRSTATTTITPPIVEHGYWGNDKKKRRRYCRRPYLKVEWDEQLITIELPCDTEFTDSQQLQLTVSKGALGYYVIESHQVIASGASSPHRE